MPRLLAPIALLTAWLCASGAALDLAQAFAWARMFGSYVHSESVIAAAKDTFDPDRPCPICKAVSHARDEAKQQAPAQKSPSSEKFYWVLVSQVGWVGRASGASWTESEPALPFSRVCEVPVPPPRAAAVG